MADLKKKQQFFIEIPLFEKHGRTSLEDFVYNLEEISCGFGKKIFSEGEIIRKVYIVKQGEFLLEKNIIDEEIVGKNKLYQNKSMTEEELKISTKHIREFPYRIVGPK